MVKTIQVTDIHDIFIGENIENQNNFFGKGKKPTLTYHQGNTASLEITIDENLFSLLDIQENDGKLTIRSKNDDKIRPTNFTIKVSSPELHRIDIRGVMDFISEAPLKTDDLEISVGGVGDVKINSLACEDFNYNLSGVGELIVNGEVDKGNYTLTGVGKIKAFDCRVKDLTCNLSGVGSMEVNATERLDANSSGVGNIRYKGNASVNQSSSGVGSIKSAN